jgi:hypothetical protein
MSRKELLQELRDLLIRDFAMKHTLANSEVAGLLRKIPELGLVPKPVKISKREEKALRRVEQEELQDVAAEFLAVIKEKVASLVLLHDLEGLDRLVTQVEMVGHFEIVKVIRDKGFHKELSDLCDKVGRKEKQ